MIKLWHRISNTGIKDTPDIETRNIVLSNQVTIVIFILSIVTAFILDVFFIRPTSAKLAVVIAILITPVWMFNYIGKTTTSRFYLSIFLPSAIVFTSIYSKIVDSSFEYEFEYYDTRLFLLATATLPLIFFELKEKEKLLIGSLYGLLLIIFYDPLHNLFKVGYYQVGHTSPYYKIINFVIVISYFIISSGILILKSIIHKFEKKNQELIQYHKESQAQLKTNNNNLQLLNTELLESHEAIKRQAAELKSSQEKIFNASHIIASQREELKAKNKMLEIRLRSQDKSLLEINTELIKRNHELSQFGYTVSHNLRGPIASLLGLSHIFDKQNAYPANKNIIEHIFEVSKNLDIIIKDLNNIVELRKDAQVKKETINLREELEVVLSSMREIINSAKAKLDIDLKANEIEGVKSYIHSIFFNLIDNSIKFRSHKRPLIIEINSYFQNGNIFLNVKDNGIGFDVTQHYEHVFHLYKRFHTSTPGRGLGLYLTKLQVEKLKGEIMVNSVIDKGTTFNITFPAVQDGVSH